MLKDKFNEVMTKYVQNCGWSRSVDDNYYAVYILLFGKVPHRISLYDYDAYMKPHFTTMSNSDKCVGGEDKTCDKYDDIIVDNTFINIIESLDKSGTEYINMRNDDYPFIVTADGDMIFYSMGLYVFSQKNELPDYVMNSLVFPDEDSHEFQYLMYDRDGFDTMSLNVKDTDVDLSVNYNDDLPHEEIVDFLNSDESGLVVLRGLPGSGKSHYLRYLITNVDREFIYMDANSFDSITDASFMRTLMDHENGVLILEDCESLLVGRLEGNNSKLSALLNLTDGLIGDSFKFKVICTFNADLGKIDTALRRKGRLKIQYEFKKLCAEKVRMLADTLPDGEKIPTKEMTLAEIYNYGNDVDRVKQKEMGFKLS